MAARLRKMDFEKIIQRGETVGVPGGFVSQTPNGTATWRGTGHNKQYDWDRPQVDPDATRPAGRSNRTGE